MIIVHDGPSAALALAGTLDPPMRAALEAELALLTSGEHDLTDHTDILVIEPGDTEADVMREAGLSPQVHPPAWDRLTRHPGYFRMVLTFGSTFACILLVPDAPGVLHALCRGQAA